MEWNWWTCASRARCYDHYEISEEVEGNTHFSYTTRKLETTWTCRLCVMMIQDMLSSMMVGLTICAHRKIFCYNETSTFTLLKTTVNNYCYVDWRIDMEKSLRFRSRVTVQMTIFHRRTYYRNEKKVLPVRYVRLRFDEEWMVVWNLNL